ncbi:expressed hypothetical protein [Trichoplax adhaerens]|uniref:Large ribosomal subunit protein uL4 C-terminal domain-containing protein n=1 Tax=Trichoplax adhaerens TaxID=10228 RepID=B3RZ62_TRIAD|nr:expressed hypothetical protein [Trichoplax adhaerens]EDV24148.1 expressed hypothetical protein [Trichoplax adhaerens]|eukprot:XP_002113674.1 expressed hypothetical protein [Trichoplax adhaerens]
MPAVLKAPIRPDLVQFVHTNMAKNKRQPYAVSTKAGHQTSAESWGTGRAVARIPRVRGGGTHRSGQAAYGNMCRGGRMFAPTRVWRRWTRKSNLSQRRYACASALAASSLPALVMARGHRIENIQEVPLVVSDSVESITKTSAAVAFLKRVNAYQDVEKVKASRTLRTGKGKLRNRRYVQRRGPLIIYNADNGIVKAFRNVPGVELAQISRLNLLSLAPGGHMGRFCVWGESAFKKLDSVFGTWRKLSEEKSNYNLPRSIMTTSDIARIINSNEVQSSIRPAKSKPKRAILKKNPLKNVKVMLRLNPHSAATKRQAYLASNKKARQELLEKKRKIVKKPAKGGKKSGKK